MQDLAGFREAVRGYRRTVGRTQQQLARSVGLHPHVLSHKLNGRDHAVLTTSDVAGIVITLAGWAALRSRAEAERLLALMDMPVQAIAASAWAAPPLADLPAGEPAGLPADRSAEVTDERPLRPVSAPVPPTPLIGRGAQRRAVRDELARSRLVTLTGVGGTGKTRLAVQAAIDLAGDYPDGVAFADLAAVHDPQLLALALARALGLAAPTAETAEEHVTEALRGRQLLLVLDNLEQLLDATPLLGRLLAAAPQLRILATSRIPLRLYGEAVLRVPPLGLAGGQTRSEAVQLFLHRAHAARADFAADPDDLAVIGKICAALDGLPLAIELAAARVKLYPPRTVLALVGDRLATLTGGPRDLPHRQQTLRAALDWSHELLDPAAQRLFAHLGVFAGPFDAAAAAAVHGSDDDPTVMLMRLEDLCDQSLLEVTPGKTPQFRLLETVRDYALARLAETGEQDAVHRRHLDYYLAVSAAAEVAADGPEQRAHLDALESAYANVRAAFDFAHAHGRADAGCLDAGLRLAIALTQLWQRRLSLADGMWQLDRLLALDAETGGAAPATRAHALLAAATLQCFRGEYASTTRLAARAIPLLRELGDHRGLARAHRFLGEAAIAVGDDDVAEPHFRRELAEAEADGNERGRGAAYNMLGQVARHRGRYAEATALLHHALRLFGAAHDRDAVGAVLNSLGEVSRDAGDAERARRRYAAALHRHRQLGNARGIAYDLEGLAAVAGLRGDGRAALRYLGAAQYLRERSGGPLPPVEQAIVTRLIAPAVQPLGRDEHDRALAEGRSGPLDRTISDALRHA